MPLATRVTAWLAGGLLLLAEADGCLGGMGMHSSRSASPYEVEATGRTCDRAADGLSR
ncbi:hypothetical protein PV396_08935 [Streptomyces sp. ME02-8801-2C]|uniref:hypothetical protein n=1 Tax=Streptomyces sp. ME02-8801-2C TaxID=3028680 RepID=UPI0029BE4377|nr:hypothetical protein [Streptomyces sp. ME02-8801-2C]MDX3452069.1 hypothetical protein [Streptomyces sp. ME02-8801-2C]